MNTVLLKEIETLVLKSRGSLDELLLDLISTNGYRTLTDPELNIFDIYNYNGLSGYNYWINGNLVAQIHFGNLINGGFVTYRRFYNGTSLHEIFDYYNAKGELLYTNQALDQGLITYNLMTMEVGSPITNHFYNILYLEYEKASAGSMRTKEVFYIEKFLNDLQNKKIGNLGVNLGSQDLALKNIQFEIEAYDQDPILKWSERQEIFKRLKEIRSKIINTKKRAHKLNFLTYNLKISLDDIRTSFKLLRKRPGSNIKGLIYKYTLGNLFWFLGTVKSNLGYSIALAIYGPFTFYFITQPMNPHAMWAVGKVRDAYIGVLDSFDELKNSFNSNTNETLVAESTNMTDSVSTTESATKKDIILPESKETWEERMSKFKAVQIGYEGNMVFAARIGRIEQLENQYSFPLTADALWLELKRYENNVKGALTFNTNLDHRFKNYLNAELSRISEYKYWAFERLSQFYLDHPFMGVDQNNEQTEKSVYTSRGFILLKEMALDISENLEGRILPENHKMIIDLAKKYESAKKNDATIIGSLKKNSKLFASKDVFDTDDFRSYMSRHWEIMFLQQNKKQEASSFGLQSYTWSVKNALWIMQTIISAKKEELGTLTYKFNLNNSGTETVQADPMVTHTFESMLEFLVTEFTGIQKEINQYLNDKEVNKRKEIISMLWKSFEERDGLFSSKTKLDSHKTANN